MYLPLYDTFHNGGLHSKTPDGNVTVNYDDRDVEPLDITNMTWKYTDIATFAQNSTLEVSSQQKNLKYI